MSKKEIRQIKTISINIGTPLLLVFFIFLALKLTNIMDCSWWWVTSPLWIPIGLCVAIFVVILFIMLIAVIFS